MTAKESRDQLAGRRGGFQEKLYISVANAVAENEAQESGCGGTVFEGWRGGFQEKLHISVPKGVTEKMAKKESRGGPFFEADSSDGVEASFQPSGRRIYEDESAV